MALMWRLAKTTAKILGGLIIIFVGILIAKNSIKHCYPYSNPSSFVALQEDYYFIYLPALYGHIISSPLILLLGILGFSQGIRERYIGLHKIVGKTYVSLVLFISAPAGLVMAILAAGGWSIKLCFIILALLWWHYTWQAWQTAKNKAITQHQNFMLRSYALTVSAVNLRIYSFVAAYFFSWYGIDSYFYLAWLSWVPNLLFVEFYIWRNSKSVSKF